MWLYSILYRRNRKKIPKKAISETACASNDIYRESIDGDVLEAEVFAQ